MPYVHVDIDLAEFDDQDLIRELTDRGIKVDGSYIDDEDEREERKLLQKVQYLYNTYLTMSPEFFQKELKQFFKDVI